ncbi:MAG TPA: CHAT domain-containing protein [Polyangiaceae bacterium]|jgi:hypothetical protein
MRPEWISQEYVVVHSSWSPARAQEYLKRRRGRFAVVLDRDAPTHDQPTALRYFVLQREDAIARLGGVHDSVRAALDLGAKVAPASVVSATGSGPPRPAAPQVVLGARGLAGVFAGQPRALRGGETRGPQAPGAGAATAPAPLVRYLGAQLPPTMKVGAEATLLVRLDGVAKAGPSNAMNLPAGTRLDVVVAPLEGLSIVGATDGSFTVAQPQPDLPLRFKVKAEKAGESGVRVYAFHGPTSVAALHVSAQIVEGTSSEAHSSVAATARVSIVPRSPPDLSLLIFEEGDALMFRLNTEGEVSDGNQFHYKKFGPTRLLSRPREYFRTFFRDIERLPLDTGPQVEAARQRLKNKGATLFEAALPADLRAILWQQRERIRTVQITSDEPWVPWEVCRLTGKGEDGRVVDGPFLAEAFEVTRWLYGAAPPAQLTLRKLALVVPGDSGLTNAQAEADFVRGLGQEGRQVIPLKADFLEITDAMAHGSYDVWHFTGHGRADVAANADQDVIELSGGQFLRPEDVSGEVENVLASRPIVFLNACQTSQGGLSLSSIGGWAQRFICPETSGSSASAFIGSYWSVGDDAALTFARMFYTRLIAGDTIGRAARAARAAVRDTGDPTWLAYTVYADPNARLA